MTEFLAYRVEESEEGFSADWQWVEEAVLPENDVLIEVVYSSINYKDALSASGNKGVTRNYPHTPGIDVAGRIIEDKSGNFQSGQEVVVFGYDLGMNICGGYGQKVRVPVQWVLNKPAELSLAQSMAWGTAGFTAALSVEKLLRSGVSPANGPVAVTGATGGVGSVAVALLAKLDFEVVAITGKPDAAQWLKDIGAKDVIAREEISAFAAKPMAKPLYQGAVDTCGGDMISALLPVIQHSGAVTTCGMVAGAGFKASVFPFILRNVDLLGVDSVEIPLSHKQAVLNKVADEWSLEVLEQLTTDIGRAELPAVLDQVLSGKGQGRYRLSLNN